MLERIRNNLELKLIALALALGAWAYLRFAPSPVIAARFDRQLTVPIVNTGLLPGLRARYRDTEALVSIASPRGGGLVRPEDVRAVLSLEGKGPGVYNVPVEIIAPRFQIKSLVPSSVTLSIERVQARTIPVSVRYLNERHFATVVDSALLAPQSVSARGVTSDLARIDSAQIDVPLPQGEGSLDEMERPVVVDAHGAPIDAVTVSPNLVRVRAHFLPGGRKK
jgi:hypothetical protein